MTKNRIQRILNIFTLLLLFHFSLFGQNNGVHAHKSEALKFRLPPNVPSAIFEMGNFVYSVHYKGKAIHLRKLAKTDLSLVEEWKLKDPALSKFTIYKFLSTTKTESGLSIMAHVYNSKRKQEHVFNVQITATGEIQNAKKVFSTTEHTGSVKSIVEYKSPNSRISVFYIEKYNQDGTRKLPEFVAVSDHLNVMWRGVPTVKGNSRMAFLPINMTVDNKGNFYILGYETTSAKINYKSHLNSNYFIAKYFQGENTEKYNVDKPELILHGGGIGLNPSGNVIFSSFYSLAESESLDGTLTIILDKGLQQLNQQQTAFSEDTVQKLMAIPNMTMSSDFKPAEQFHNNGKTTLVMECYSSGLLYSYGIALFFVEIDSQNGRLIKMQYVPSNIRMGDQFKMYYLEREGNDIDVIQFDMNYKLLVEEGIAVKKNMFSSSLVHIKLNAYEKPTYTLLINKDTFGKFLNSFTSRTVKDSERSYYGLAQYGVNKLVVYKHNLPDPK